MLFLGANPLVLALLAGLAAGKTGVTGALPRRSPQAFSYDVSVKEKKNQINIIIIIVRKLVITRICLNTLKTDNQNNTNNVKNDLNNE